MLVCTAGYLYASNGIQSKIGYANLEAPNANAVLSLKLGPRGLAPIKWFFAKALENNEHQNEAQERLVRNVMQELKGAQLRIYDVGSNRQVFDSAIADAVSELKKKGWEPLVVIRDENETVVVLQYGTEQIIEGLSIMANIDDSAVFLNLVGPFDPKTLSDSSQQIY